MTETLDTPSSDGRRDARDPRLLLTIGGAIGLIASFILTIDKIGLLQDTIDGNVQDLNCDINAFVSCSGVMNSSQAEAFGFLNSLLGIIGFTVVLVIGVVTLTRTALPEFIWAGLQLGVLFGIGFVSWLQSQSIYEIGKLCPWCMVVWTVMIPTFVGVTARNLRAWAPNSPVTRVVSNWTGLIIALWYIVILALIWFKFGEDLWA